MAMGLLGYYSFDSGFGGSRLVGRANDLDAPCMDDAGFSFIRRHFVHWLSIAGGEGQILALGIY